MRLSLAELLGSHCLVSPPQPPRGLVAEGGACPGDLAGRGWGGIGELCKGSDSKCVRFMRVVCLFVSHCCLFVSVATTQVCFIWSPKAAIDQQ